MKKKHASSMMQPTNFTDFNPLDVLAAAASLQRRSDQTDDDSENDSQKTGSGSNNEEESKEGAEDEDGTETVEKCETKVAPADAQESSVSKVVEPAKEVGKIKVPTNGETILVKKAGVEIVARNHSADGKTVGVGVNRTVVTLGDASKMIIPTQKGNKALTVVRINKQQLTDHSYAYVCQLQNLKHEEDEGYSSRSSLDEEAEELVQRNGHSGVSNIGGMVGRASTPTVSPKIQPRHVTIGALATPKTVVTSPVVARKSEEITPPTAVSQNDLSRKPTKIVIVSQDSKVQGFISGANIVSPGSTTSSTITAVPAAVGATVNPLAGTLKSEGNAVLRTLLRQRPSIQTSPKGGNAKVVVAGNLSGRVINVLKGGGSIALAPPTSNNLLQSVEDVTFTAPLPQTRTKFSEPPVPAAPEAPQTANTAATPTTGTVELGNGDGELDVQSQVPADTNDTQEEVVPEDIGVTQQQGQELLLQHQSDDQTEQEQTDPNVNVTPEVVEDNTKLDCDTPILNPEEASENIVEGVTTPDPEVFQEESPMGEALPPPSEEQTPSEESSRHWSEASTEDEASCDSKGLIAVDTTPVMSPSTDYSSPLLSPVCERDVPMMSPLVESQSSCDIFRLPYVVKPLSTSSSPSSGKTVKDIENELVGDDTCFGVASKVFMKDIEEGENSCPPLLTSGNDASSTEEESSETLLGDSAEEADSQVLSSCEQPSDGALQTEINISADPSVEPNNPKPADLCLESPSQGESPAEVPDQTESTDNGQTIVAEVQSISAHSSANTPESPESMEGENVITPPISEDSKDSVEIPVLEAGVGDALKSVSFTPLEGKNSKNQYIIEDDESPVAKFGPPRVMSDEVLNSTCASPITLAIPASSPSTVQLSATADPTKALSLHANVCVNGKTSSPKEPVKMIMTTEAGPRSLFTAVRRPLMAGMKALPGNLQVLPMVQSAKGTGGVMHVVPVSGARGLMTQIIPKTGGQIVTGVPMLGGKTVMLPDASKGRMSTLLVPVSVTSASGVSPASSISLVQNSKNKLLNVKQMDSRKIRAGSESESVASPKPQRKDVTSPLFFHGRITPVSSITSDTSELLSSPENSLHAGFSGIIMGGRTTPDNFENKSGRFSLDKDKLGFKASSNSLILDSDDSMSSESGFATKKEIGIGSIGAMGSLSWKNIESPARGLTPIGIGGSGGREYVRIQGGEVKTGITMSDEDSMPPLELMNQKKTKNKSVDGLGGKSIHAYSRKKKKMPEPALSPPLPVDELNPQMARLHPLIDHDYCMFTEFNAQIQSSIIATTESKTKIEKKYAKKSKAVRTKAGRALITEESIKASVKAHEEKTTGKGKRGRLKKRSASKDKVLTDDELSYDGIDDQIDQVSVAIEAKPRKMEPKPSRTSERRAKMQALKDDKNYVKITGSYQNEFVYFATKNKRNRPRKSLEDANAPNQKQPQVGGMAVFDWYKEMSRADKSSHFGTPTGSRFGTPTTSSPSSPAPYNPSEAEINSISPAPASDSLTTITTSTATLPASLSSSFRPESTTIHESDVADLVCDLSEIDTLGTSSVPQVPPVNDVDLSPYLLGSQDVKSGPMPSTSATEENSSSEDVDRMAEQVRSMLNSMGADELENLELKLGSVETTPTGMTDTSFDGFLGGFTHNHSSLATPSTSNNLCDLDEINDSDLLRSDIANMNTILGDVKTTVATTTHLKPSASAPSLLTEGQGERLPTPDPHTYGYSKTLEFGNVKLDKSELFPEVSTPTSTPDVSALAADSAPELTVVSMYWNDLPGLVLMGQQYVRLVDIHKQVLPAKDTGILKKRCQMMGLPIANCTELQRDFLVRYANAAKSKSTVIVSKEAAQTLIGFYVEPKSRTAKQSSLDIAPSTPEPSRSQGGKDKTPAMPKPKAGTSTADGQPVARSPELPSTPTDGKNRSGGKLVSRKRRLTGGSLTDASPGSPSVSPASLDLKRSARLRHKKVCYSDMLLGNHYENQEKEKSEEVIVHEPVVVTPKEQAPREPVAPSRDRESESEVSDDHENKEVTKTYTEDLEIRRLKIKMRKKTLTLKEKRRLRRLREKVRKRDLKRRFRDKAKIDVACTKKKAAAVVAAAMMGLAKSKRKLQATHVFTKKYNQEHCYAAAPESPGKIKTEQETEDQVPSSDSNSEEIKSGTPEPAVGVKVEQQEGNVTVVVTESPETTKPTVAVASSEDKLKTVNPTTKTTSTEAPKSVLSPPTSTSSSKEGTVKEEKKAEPSPPPPKTNQPKRTPLAVLHRDAVHRLSQRSRWQDGELHTDLYSQLDSACIRCMTCSDFFTVKRFLKHMHHQNKRDELAHVTLSQTLELRDADGVTEEERSMWTEFKTRREELLSQKTPVSRRSRSLSFKSADGKAKQAESPKTTETTSTPTSSTATPTTPKTASPKKEQQLQASTVPRSSGTFSPTHVTSGGVNPSSSASKSSVEKDSSASTPTVAVATPTPTKNGRQMTHVTPVTTTRHSTRVRKRKQLHPIEKYVFSKASPAGGPQDKRQKLDAGYHDGQYQAPTQRGGLVSSTPVRKVRMKLSSGDVKAAGSKYALRGPLDSTRH